MFFSVLAMFFRICRVRKAILTIYLYRQWNVFRIAHAELSVLGLICPYHLIFYIINMHTHQIMQIIDTSNF